MTADTALDESRTMPNVPLWIRSHRPWIVGVIVTVAFLGLALLASLPTGADRPQDAVPPGARLADDRRIDDDTRVQVLSSQGRISVQVAYRGPKGWLGTGLGALPDDTVAAWAATGGSGPVPALSVVYGRAPAEEIEVTWEDGEVTTAQAASDGVFVVARDGRHRSRGVVMRDAAGASVLEVDGP